MVASSRRTAPVHLHVRTRSLFVFGFHDSKVVEGRQGRVGMGRGMAGVGDQRNLSFQLEDPRLTRSWTHPARQKP